MERIEQCGFSNALPDGGDYKKPYLALFNAITNAIFDIERMNFGQAKQTLITAQQNAEEAYLASWSARAGKASEP